MQAALDSINMFLQNVPQNGRGDDKTSMHQIRPMMDLGFQNDVHPDLYYKLTTKKAVFTNLQQFLASNPSHTMCLGFEKGDLPCAAKLNVPQTTIANKCQTLLLSAIQLRYGRFDSPCPDYGADMHPDLMWSLTDYMPLSVFIDVCHSMNVTVELRSMYPGGLYTSARPIEIMDKLRTIQRSKLFKQHTNVTKEWVSYYINRGWTQILTTEKHNCQSLEKVYNSFVKNAKELYDCKSKSCCNIQALLKRYSTNQSVRDCALSTCHRSQAKTR